MIVEGVAQAHVEFHILVEVIEPDQTVIAKLPNHPFQN